MNHGSATSGKLSACTAEGESGLALINVAGSLAVGLAAVVAGWVLGAAL